MPMATTNCPGRWDRTSTTCADEGDVVSESDARETLPGLPDVAIAYPGYAVAQSSRTSEQTCCHEFPEWPRAKAGGWKARQSPTIILPNNNNTHQTTWGEA